MNEYRRDFLSLTLSYILALAVPIGLDYGFGHLGVKIRSELLCQILFWLIRFLTLIVSKNFFITKNVKYVPLQSRPFSWKMFGIIVLCISAGLPLIGLLSTLTGKDPMDADVYAGFVGLGMSSEWHSKTNMLFFQPLVNTLFYRFFMFRDFSMFMSPLLAGVFTSMVSGLMNMEHYRETYAYNAIHCLIYHLLDYHPFALAFLVALEGGITYLNIHMYHAFHVSSLGEIAASRIRRAFFLENLMSYGENNNFLQGVIKATSKIPSDIKQKYIDHLKAESEWATMAYYYMNDVVHQIGNITNIL